MAAEPFWLTFWCGPPLAELDDARAAEIAAAGFTVIGPPCEGGWDPAANRRALDVAARHGLQMLLGDHRFGAPVVETPDWEQGVAAAVGAYRDHAAVAGYFIMDEPVVEQFESVAAVVAEVRAADPARIAYVNLLPNYVPPKNLGAASYADYVERFATEVRPQLLSYDYYPFGREKDRSTYFANLATVRDAALRHGVPFMLIALAMPHGPYRDPTEAELAWQVFHALAFGARGISYFTYWTPPPHGEWKHRYGLIEHGRRTLHYYQVVRINRALRALAAELAAYRSLAVADSAGEIGAAFPIGPIASIAGGPVTAGLFTGSRGELAVLLVNRDYRYGVTARLQLRPEAPPPDVFDAETGRWMVSATPAFLLPPGEARLIRFGAPGE